MSDPLISPVRYERQDVNLNGIVITGVILAAVVGIACLVSWWAYDYLQSRDRASKHSPFPLAVKEGERLQKELPKEPRLEEIDRLRGKEVEGEPGQLYAKERRRLETYGWVDEESEIVHIPIERAMDLLVEQKRLPARAEK